MVFGGLLWCWVACYGVGLLAVLFAMLFGCLVAPYGVWWRPMVFGGFAVLFAMLFGCLVAPYVFSGALWCWVACCVACYVVWLFGGAL